MTQTSLIKLEIIYVGRNENIPSQRPPRNRKFSEFLVSNYNIVPKTPCIAPDRFLARSHLVEVTTAPNNLVTGSIWDSLSQQVWKRFISNQQTERTYITKMMLWKQLYYYIRVNITYIC